MASVNHLAKDNLFSNLPSNLEEESFEAILQSAHFKLERIVSLGHATPENTWLEQDETEWVVLVRGKAGLRFEGEKDVLEMNAGDYILIPAQQRHRVEWTQSNVKTIWLALHFQSE